jgi:Na+/proline symporter
MYLIIQFSIGYWVSRSIKTEGDYLLAGRHAPGFLITFSLFATWFGAETCIGTSGQVYEQGLSGGRADPFGYSICLVLLGLLIAPRIWNSKYTTLADFYKHRFGNKTEKLAIAILLGTSIVWGAAQIRAFGQIITASSDIPVHFAISIGFTIVLLYSLLGGMMGDILSDFVQGLILITGLSVMLWMVLQSEGLSIFNQPSERLSFLAPGESFIERIERWTIPIIGSLVAQESISRILASKNKSSAQKSAFAASLIYLIVGMIPVLLGLIGPQVLPGLEDKEHYLMALSQKYLHPAAQALLLGALISAILSTIDSILLSSGAILSHNLIIPHFQKSLGSHKLLAARACVVIIAILAYLVALESDGIYELLESAATLGTAGLIITTLMGLWTDWGGESAALATLVVGIVFKPIAEHVLNLPAPFISTVLVALVTYLMMYGLKVRSNIKLKS